MARHRSPVFTPDEAMEYLALPSRHALQRLVDARKLVPLCYAKEHRFALAELDRFVTEELAQERLVRGVETGD